MTFYCSRWCNKTLYIQPNRAEPCSEHTWAAIIFFSSRFSFLISLEPKQMHDTHVNNIVRCRPTRSFTHGIVLPTSRTHSRTRLTTDNCQMLRAVCVCCVCTILIFDRIKTKMNRIMKLMATSHRCVVHFFLPQADAEHWCAQLIYTNHVYDTDASINNHIQTHLFQWNIQVNASPNQRMMNLRTFAVRF